MEPSKRHKILFVITKSNLGGAQRYVYELATHLPKEKYDVVVAFGGNGALQDALHKAQIRTLSIPSFARDINLRKEFGAARELSTIIQNEKPDIVHLNSSKAGGTGALVARLCGVRKIIFTAHGWPFKEDRTFLWKTIVWLLSYLTTLLSHNVIVVSRSDKMHARMPFQNHTITQISTAVPDIAFKPRDEARLLIPEALRIRHERSVWIVSTGEHTQNKNLITLLKAVRSLVHSGTTNVFLTLMSDGEDRAMLEAYVREHALTDYVHFTGFVNDARTYLRAFDIFTLPSLKEGMPYGLLEAGMAELACVGSDVGGIPEIIVHASNGLLVDPKNESALTEALLILIQHEDVRNQYRRGIATTLRDKTYSLKYMIDQTELVYQL